MCCTTGGGYEVDCSFDSTAPSNAQLPTRPPSIDLDSTEPHPHPRGTMALNPSKADPLERAERLRMEGDFEGAIAALRSAPETVQDSTRALRVARDCYMRIGAVSRSLGALNRLRALTGDADLDAHARRLLGRMIETDVTWLPPVPASIEAPSTPGVILHLLKESLPYSETGFTFRSRMTLQAQISAGYQPVVITSPGFPRYKGIVDFPGDEIVDGIRHHRVDVDSARDLPYDVLDSLYAEAAARLADEVGASLVQAGSGFRGVDTALVGAAIARRSGVPFVYEVRGFQEATWTSDYERSERGEYYHRRKRQEDRCLRMADHVITIGEAMRDDIVARGIRPDNVSVVSNVVDVARFTPREKRSDLLARYGLEGRPVIGYISNLGFREGFPDLIRATALMAARGVDLTCLVVGNGPEKPRLEELVRELGVERNVIITGHVPNTEIEDHYALIDVFVIPRVNDRAARLVTPLKPLEAMAMGIPLAVSDLPALRELALPGERGMTFEPSNPDSLADVVLEMLGDNDLRSRLAETARAWVLSERSYDSNVPRYRNALAPLLG